MKVFSQSKYKLSQMHFGMRVMIVFFLLMILMGFGCGLILGIQKMGFSPSSIAQYYRGSGDDIAYPKSLLELLETAHFHFIGMPLVFLVVGHLAMMTSFSSKAIGRLIAIGFVGIFLNIMSPFLIRFLGAGFAYGVMVSVGLLCVAFVGLVGSVFWELKN